ncbi:hypothetical protein CASFOL_029069 [Castilleja foliolosa]|uniref:AB hydrolase-1 domain-containing protein n=1 Tax=Castilleja foliolosa TaxID=1961234 RepID=A0ABD3CEE0_9LAMI
MEKIEHKYVQVNGLKLHVAEIGNESSPAVVFLHGFPEIWYSWRHQMIAVAGSGFRAIAADYRGYGLSDPPPEPEKATFLDLINDLLALLDALNLSKVIIGFYQVVDQMPLEYVVSLISTICTPCLLREELLLQHDLKKLLQESASEISRLSQCHHIKFTAKAISGLVQLARYIKAPIALRYGTSVPRSSSFSSLGRNGSFSILRVLPIIGVLKGFALLIRQKATLKVLKAFRLRKSTKSSVAVVR